MSSRYNSDSSGPNDSDLPEFDPEVLDAFPRAIAAMQQSEIINEIIGDAIEQEGFRVEPDRIPFDCEFMSAMSKLYPKLTPTQLREKVCLTLNSLFYENRGLLYELRREGEEYRQYVLHHERLKQEMKKDDLYFRFLQISSIAMVLSLTTVFVLVGMLLFQKIQHPVQAIDYPIQHQIFDQKPSESREF